MRADIQVIEMVRLEQLHFTAHHQATEYRVQATEYRVDKGKQCEIRETKTVGKTNNTHTTSTMRHYGQRQNLTFVEQKTTKFK